MNRGQYFCLDSEIYIGHLTDIHNILHLDFQEIVIVMTLQMQCLAHVAMAAHTV